MGGASMIKTPLPCDGVLDDKEGRGPPLEPMPGIDLVLAPFEAGADGHGVERTGATREIENAQAVAEGDEVREHNITLLGTSFPYSVAAPGARRDWTQQIATRP
jgi:hypothetical protein